MARRATFHQATLTALAALLLAGGTALGAVRAGTDGNETLTGTNAADLLNGKGGNDLLQGLAGNDVYQFAGDWGTDTVVDKARYKIGEKSVPGGTDTLSFAQETEHLQIALIRQWPDSNRAFTQTNRVNLGASVVETAIGGRGDDFLFGGAEANTLQPGGGSTDYLYDYGGTFENVPFSALPKSDDVFKGFGAHRGRAYVYDWGGTADVLDLRPFASGDVLVEAVKLDPWYPAGTGSTTRESLLIATGETTGVFVVGHFGEHTDNTSRLGQQGRIEKLVFADGTFSGKSEIAGPTGGAVATGKGAQFAKAAKRLADQAWEELRRHPVPHPHRAGAGEPRGDATANPAADRLTESANAGRTDEGDHDLPRSGNRGGDGEAGHKDEAAEHRSPDRATDGAQGDARAGTGRGR